MKHMLTLLLLAPAVAFANCGFTPEQDRLVKLAYSYGLPFDYGKTLASIVVQESFVGKYVVKINSDDAP